MQQQPLLSNIHQNNKNLKHKGKQKIPTIKIKVFTNLDTNLTSYIWQDTYFYKNFYFANNPHTNTSTK